MTSQSNTYKSPTVSEILRTMNYGSVMESETPVQEWLSKHKDPFGLFINGTWQKKEKHQVFKTKNICTGETLAILTQGETSDIDEAIESAKATFQSWSQLSGCARSRYLYSIARHLQKHQQLFTVLESLDTGRAIHEIKNLDVPQTVRCFYYHSGWAELKDDQLKDWKPLGIISIILPWNFPLMYLAFVVAPAIAVGNTVIVKPSSTTPLSALLFAEICNEAGLPPGVYNVITGSGNSLGKYMSTHPDVNKVAFIGSTEVGKQLRFNTAGLRKNLSVQLGGRSSMIIFDSSDQDSVIEGIVDGLLFNQGQTFSAASCLLIQESVYESIVCKLKYRFKSLRIGNGLDKCIDLGSIISEGQLQKIKEFVEEAQNKKAMLHQEFIDFPNTGYYYPPTLITDADPGLRISMNEVFGPVIFAMPFRTAKEAIALANNSAYGLAASVWATNSALSLEVAKNLRVSTVWINCHSIIDAAAAGLSGFGFQDGKEGLYSFLQPSCQNSSTAIVNEDISQFAISTQNNSPSVKSSYVQIKDEIGTNLNPSVDQTYKIYIGGAQKRPDSNSSRTVYDPKEKVLGQVGECNRKDVRDAVEAAHKAQVGWNKRSGYQRTQILYFIAENLQKRSSEFVNYLMSSTLCTEKAAEKEVDASINALFSWGSYCDKYGGNMQETTMNGSTFQICEAVGVIGIVCPEETPLLSFISLLALAICRGNAIIIVPSEKYPLVCLNMCQILSTSDVPAGVVNVLTGSNDHLARQLAEHHDVNAIWYFGSAKGSKMVEQLSSCNMKRTWVNYGQVWDWYDLKQSQKEDFLHYATHFKTIWIPMGEIFAN